VIYLFEVTPSRVNFLIAVAFQKECETNLSREQKNAAMFANRISWRNITITSLTEVTAVSATNTPHEWKKSLLWTSEKRFVCSLEIARKHFDKHSKSQASPKITSPTYNSVSSSRTIRFVLLFTSYKQALKLQNCRSGLFPINDASAQI